VKDEHPTANARRPIAEVEGGRWKGKGAVWVREVLAWLVLQQGHLRRQVAELFDTHPTLEVGPEIKATVPKWDFSASVRYLRLLTNPDEGVGSYTENVMALTLSKRF